MTKYVCRDNGYWYDSEINGKNMPKNVVKVSEKDYLEIRSQLVDSRKQLYFSEEGNVEVVELPYTLEELSVIERSWRNSELRLVDIEINKIMDSLDYSPSNLKNLRIYRQELRDWPSNTDFPESSKRPKLR